MYQKFISCGYSKEELDNAKTKALLLNRNNLLKLDNPINPTTSPDLTYNPSPTAPTTKIPKSLMFISTYSCFTSHVKSLIQELKADIATLIGHENIIFANKKNPNTSSLLFCKSSFAQPPKIFNKSEKCGTKKFLMCKF